MLMAAGQLECSECRKLLADAHHADRVMLANWVALEGSDFNP